MIPHISGDCSALVASEPGPPYTLIEAPGARRSRVVVTSPHSGRRYPSGFVERAALGLDALRQVEDAGMDRLLCYQPLPSPILLAEYPRSYVDLNRAAGELDAAMFDGPVACGKAGGRSGGQAGVSRYLRWGLGVIPGKAANLRDIYDAPLPASEAGERLERCYAPFHSRLAGLLEEAAVGGDALLLDCHSMPSSQGGAGRGRGAGRNRNKGYDIVIGDGHGRTAQSGLVARAREFFEREGLSVALNSPYAGGHITRNYGRPENGVSAIQVEVCRSLYLDEERVQLKPGWQETASLLCRFVMAMDAGLDAV